MVKNILILRFANMFFSSIWNKYTIDSVTITFKENIGTEGMYLIDYFKAVVVTLMNLGL